MSRLSYSKAGVDISRVRKIQRSLGERFQSTFSNRVGRIGIPLLPIGHYGGLIDIGGGVALTLHTDGVGTKVLVAQQLGKFDTIGIDCVAMTVNDLICLGSEPIAILDYIALERENEKLVDQLAEGLEKGARLANVSIVGGETAIMRDVIKGTKGQGFDLAAMGVGIVNQGKIIDGSKIKEGDVILGVASSGLHSNGYSLARKSLKGIPLRKRFDELNMSLGEALLAPTSIYVGPTLDAVKSSNIHGIAHITGGSFSKLQRLAGNRDIGFEVTLPPVSGIFTLLIKAGRIPRREMYRTFNMGVGICLVMPESQVGRVSQIFRSAGFETYDAGLISSRKGVRVNGLAVA